MANHARRNSILSGATVVGRDHRRSGKLQEGIGSRFEDPDRIRDRLAATLLHRGARRSIDRPNKKPAGATRGLLTFDGRSLS